MVAVHLFSHSYLSDRVVLLLNKGCTVSLIVLLLTLIGHSTVSLIGHSMVFNEMVLQISICKRLH